MLWSAPVNRFSFAENKGSALFLKPAQFVSPKAQRGFPPFVVIENRCYVLCGVINDGIKIKARIKRALSLWAQKIVPVQRFFFLPRIEKGPIQQAFFKPSPKRSSTHNRRRMSLLDRGSPPLSSTSFSRCSAAKGGFGRSHPHIGR